MPGPNAIDALSFPIPPFAPGDTLDHVADRLLHPDYAPVLSVPVVEDGRPVGLISRHQLHAIFMKKFGRDLYGKRPVADVMSRDFLVVEVDSPLAQAAQYVTRHMRQPVSEDFVITRDGAYQGVGAVLPLLGAMERQALRHSEELGRAYRELKASQAQLIQSEKMASLGQMVAGVAHEINTPLGYVRNNVELLGEFSSQFAELLRGYHALVRRLEDPDSPPEAVAESLDAVAALERTMATATLLEEQGTLVADTLYGLGQIGELVAGLKDFSRLDQAPTDNVSLNDCVDAALLIARNALKHRIEVIRQFGELPRLRCAPSQINQVLLNLLTNAAQAIEGPGKILVRTWVEGDRVCVAVQDNGRGMPPEVARRVFDPFFTTKPVGEGTGLGLSIAYKIVQQHGGRIRVASQPGRGTRFVVELPLPAASADASGPAAGVAPRAAVSATASAPAADSGSASTAAPDAASADFTGAAPTKATFLAEA